MIVALALAASVWDQFSSQSSWPYLLTALPTHTAPPNVEILHVSSSVGVPSYSGHPQGSGDCRGAISSVMPVARELATERAQLLAKELGVTLVSRFARGNDDVPPPSTATPPPEFAAYGDCGLPKFGRPPVSAMVSATYVMRSPELHLTSSVAPSAAPTPSVPLPAPVVPAPNARAVKVSAVGQATRRADRVMLTITLQPPQTTTADAPDTGPKNDADLKDVLSAIRELLPLATVTNQYVPLHFAVGERGAYKTNDQTGVRISVDVRSFDPNAFAKLQARLQPIADNRHWELRANTIAQLDSCYQLEDDARKDAIAKALAQLPSGTGRLLFADQGPVVAKGVCGPIIDASILFDGAPGFEPLEVEGAVPLTLEWMLSGRPTR